MLSINPLISILNSVFLAATESPSIDKKDIISSELNACEKLARYATDQTEKKVIVKEISELKTC